MKIFKSILITVIICTVFSGRVYAIDISSSNLIDQAKEYDGKEITYSGEVLGDIMKRGDFSWINVYDGNNAVGIWVTNQEANKIKVTGSYGVKGDIVRVTGVFNRACAKHGGDFDIHSNNIEVIKKGFITKTPVNLNSVYIAGGLLVISVILMVTIYKGRM